MKLHASWVAAGLLLIAGGKLAVADPADFEITTPSHDAPHAKVALVVAPDAFKKALRRAGGDDNLWLAVNFMVGNPVGLRVQAFAYASPVLRVGVEAMAAEMTGNPIGIKSEFMSPAGPDGVYAGGAGLRVEILLASGRHNAFYLSPGVDVYVAPPTTHLMGHYESIYYVASDVDATWVHKFSESFGMEIGVKAGGQIALDTPSWMALSHEAIFPELAVFTGVRF